MDTRTTLLSAPTPLRLNRLRLPRRPLTLNLLQSELMALMMGGDPGVSAFPEEDNIFCWKGTITGSKETVFEGTEYRLSLSFSNDYPFKPPKVKFETSCFHPNVDVYGNICLDILQLNFGAIKKNIERRWRSCTSLLQREGWISWRGVSLYTYGNFNI
ncbi:hypothetical protein F8388_017720 [Cannabis sativa]|uniref:UBC core domain-containing protein n=1 Tax=Cannabis sativa TaxID=3483 RepID=A0A7J6HI98_CANSA|nr:hypothetical protein F8388_017720 [Cannabis sativa]